MGSKFLLQIKTRLKAERPILAENDTLTDLFSVILQNVYVIVFTI